MARDRFFTPEMGARLKAIREKVGMDKGEVAARMGLKGKGRHNLITRLETGKVVNPYLGTITRYLRACGAQFFEFYDLLTRIEPVLVDTGPIERTPMKREQKEILLRRVKREVYNFQDETSYPKRGKPIAPEKQKPAAAKLADYRVQVALIEHEVKKLLGTENVTLVEVPGYLTIARRILGELRRGGAEREIRDCPGFVPRNQGLSREFRLKPETPGTVPGENANPKSEIRNPSRGSPGFSRVTDYVKQNRLNPELAERIRQLVTELVRR